MEPSIQGREVHPTSGGKTKSRAEGEDKGEAKSHHQQPCLPPSPEPDEAGAPGPWETHLPMTSDACTLSLTPGQTESEPTGQRPAKAPTKAESPLRASADATGKWHRIVTFKPQFSSRSCSFLFGAICFSLFLATLHGLGIYFPASSAGLLLGFFAAVEMLQLPSSTCMYDLSRWTVSGVPTLRRRQLCLRGVRGRRPMDT